MKLQFTTILTERKVPIVVAFDGDRSTPDQANRMTLESIGPFDTEFDTLPDEFHSPSGYYVVEELDKGPPVYARVFPQENSDASVAVELLETEELQQRVAREGIVAESSLVHFAWPDETLLEAVNRWLLRVIPAEDQQPESPVAIMHL